MNKILLIGVGKWGKNHFRILRNIADLYVADCDPQKLAGLPLDSSRLSCDYLSLIDKVDGVVIATPAFTHSYITSVCLDKGKDVFVEKPIAISSSDVKEVASAVNGNILQVGHIYRYHPYSLKMKAIINRGDIGDVLCGWGHFVGQKEPRKDGGVTLNDAIHYFDLFNFLLEQPPKAVTSLMRTYLSPFDDASVSILEYCDRIFTVEVSNIFPKRKRDVLIKGSKGSIYCDYDKSHILLTDKEGTYDLSFEYDEPLRIELESFITSMITRQTPVADIKSSAVALRVVEACMESSEKRARVRIL